MQCIKVQFSLWGDSGQVLVTVRTSVCDVINFTTERVCSHMKGEPTRTNVFSLCVENAPLPQKNRNPTDYSHQWIWTQFIALLTSYKINNMVIFSTHNTMGNYHLIISQTLSCIRFQNPTFSPLDSHWLQHLLICPISSQAFPSMYLPAWTNHSLL